MTMIPLKTDSKKEKAVVPGLSLQQDIHRLICLPLGLTLTQTMRMTSWKVKRARSVMLVPCLREHHQLSLLAESSHHASRVGLWCASLLSQTRIRFTWLVLRSKSREIEKEQLSRYKMCLEIAKTGRKAAIAS